MRKTIWAKVFAIIAVTVTIMVSIGYVIIKNANDIEHTHLINLQKDDQAVALAKQLNLDVVQIQQWLTDISATRAAEGFDDGFEEAKNHFISAQQTIENLSKLEGANHEQLKQMSVKIKAFYETGKEMANRYIAGGPSSGNAYMKVFDKASEDLQAVLTPFLEKMDNKKNHSYDSINHNLHNLTVFSTYTFIFLTLFLGISLFLFGYWLVKNLKEKALILAKSIEQLADNSSTIKDKADQFNEMLSSQGKNLQKTAAAIQEISSMVQKSSDAAKNSADFSSESTDVATGGKQIVNEMIYSIDEIAKSNDEIMSEIQTSNSQISNIIIMISEIEEKTKVINEIVFQTKLLSFNASVEAARAGEHGKGFAVVAEEIGNLASMSGRASQEINDMLTSSTQKVKVIIEETRSKVESLAFKGKDKVEEGTKVAQNCGQSLDTIIENVARVNEMVASIASATEEQSAGVHEVTSAMQELDSNTYKNTEMAQNSLEMASQLNHQAETLQHVVRDLYSLVSVKQLQSTEYRTQYNHEENLEEMGQPRAA